MDDLERDTLVNLLTIGDKIYFKDSIRTTAYLIDKIYSDHLIVRRIYLDNSVSYVLEILQKSGIYFDSNLICYTRPRPIYING